MAQIPNLELDLRSNQLSELTDWLGHLTNLTRHDVKGNPIETPPLKVLNLDSIGGADLDALRGYYRYLAAVGTDYLHEAKLLKVGDRVTLVRKESVDRLTGELVSVTDISIEIVDDDGHNHHVIY